MHIPSTQSQHTKHPYLLFHVHKSQDIETDRCPPTDKSIYKKNPSPGLENSRDKFWLNLFSDLDFPKDMFTLTKGEILS